MSAAAHGATGPATGGAAGAVPRLVGLDWGTTSLRAFLIGADGAVLQTRPAADGDHREAEKGKVLF